jgi:hypothetical protein
MVDITNPIYNDDDRAREHLERVRFFLLLAWREKVASVCEADEGRRFVWTKERPPDPVFALRRPPSPARGEGEKHLRCEEACAAKQSTSPSSSA